MSRTIAISDDVYRMLEREKEGQSFSDVIRERLEDGGKLSDMTGAGVLGSDS